MMKLLAFVFSFLLLAIPASAEVICNFKTEKTNLRKGPSAKNFEIAAKLTNGHKLEVLERVTNPDGFEYLKVKFKNPETGKSAVAFVYHEAVEVACGEPPSLHDEGPQVLNDTSEVDKIARPFKPQEGDINYSNVVYVDSFIVKIEILGRNKSTSNSDAYGGIIRSKGYQETTQIKYKATISLDQNGALARDLVSKNRAVKGRYRPCANGYMTADSGKIKDFKQIDCFTFPKESGSYFVMNTSRFELNKNNNFQFIEVKEFNAVLLRKTKGITYSLQSIDDSEGMISGIDEIDGVEIEEKKLYSKYTGQ
jgi:hypothetical protein